MEFQDGAEDTSLMPSMRHRRRKRRIWPIVVLALVLIGWGTAPALVNLVNESQTDQEISRQIATSPAPISTATPGVSTPPGSSTPVPALESVSTPTPVQTPVTQPDSIPVELTCQSAGVVSLAILPLPEQPDPNVVDPPVTAKAVFWNARPIVGLDQEFKVGLNSKTTGLVQGHFFIDREPEEGLPFNKLSYDRYFPVGSICTVRTDSGETLTYQEVASTSLTMDQWRADPQFGVLSGPKRGYDLILQACDASDPHVLKRLVGFKLVR